MINSTIGKILVVDDEVELKTILVQALISKGYEAVGFSDGEEALEAFRGQAFDVLLTDLMMPGMDGIALIREAMQVDLNVVCIMMTGQGTIQTAVDAMKVGAFDYVLKPFRLQTMLPVLTRAMNTRHLRLENVQLREAVAIHELCETIAFTLDPQTVLSKLADAALHQSEADEVSVLLPTEQGDEFYIAAVRGERHRHLLGERVPFDKSISSWVARQRTPVILNGEVHDDRFVALWPRPEIRSSVSIPMLVAKKLVGVLNLNVVDRPRLFTLGQMKALTILAGTAAAALESASLYTQVQKAEESYRSIFENAVEGIFRASGDGRFLTANPAMAQILGYESPYDLIDSVVDIRQDLYVDPNRYADWEGRLQRGEKIVGFEAQYRRKDKSLVWLAESAHSVCDENGALLYYEGIAEDISQRKLAEAEQARLNTEIREQRERLNTIVATVPGVVFEVCGSPGAADNRTNFVSEYIGPMLGYTVSEWLSVPGFWLSIVHPDDRQRVHGEASAAFAEGANGEHEFRWIGKDGRIVWVRAHTIVVRSEDGKPVGVRGVVTDITERKRVEEMQSRREAHALFRAEVSSALAVSRAPLRATLESCSEAMVKHLGAAFARVWTLNREENVLELQSSAGIYTHIDGAHARVPVGKLKVGKIAQERAPHITNDVLNDPRVSDKKWAKQQKMVAFAGYPLQVEDRLVGVMAMFSREELPEDTLDALGSIADVVSQGIERKRAEHELRVSEERYRDLVENAHDIIYTQDLEGTYTSMNQAGAQIIGYTIEESLALNQTQTVAPEYLDKVREMLTRKLAGERVTAYEMELVAKDGHRITVEANTKLVYQDGVPVGVQGIARDVTQRKHLEDQLRQSQKMEAIGQLAGGVAHDFNNLLTAINGYSALALQRIGDNHPLRGYLEEIKKAGDRAANLTRQLLAFGRKQILQPLPINLNDVVTDMNKMLRRLIGEDIVLTAKLDSALKKIKADPGQVEQVLVNLVVNARDAMPKGGNLTIETATVELDHEYAETHVGVLPGQYVMLAVSDTGTGMDEATQARIFDPFFTTKEKGKGTGLGLSTVYGIVKQSGGSIWVYSETGHGTTFKVYLPQMITEPGKIEAIVAEPEPRGVETILLVEDEDVVRGLAKKILEQSGYKVLSASRGAEAIRLCLQSADPIHLVLTDVVMPEISGKEVADRLRELLPGLRVLFMSGYTDEAIVHHGVLDSNIEFIQKPFTPTALVRKVRKVLDAELIVSD